VKTNVFKNDWYVGGTLVDAGVGISCNTPRPGQRCFRYKRGGPVSQQALNKIEMAARNRRVPITLPKLNLPPIKDEP